MGTWLDDRRLTKLPLSERNLPPCAKSMAGRNRSLPKNSASRWRLSFTTSAKPKNPNADFVSKVAKLFNVSVDDLLGHTVKASRKHGPPSRLQQLTEQLAELPRNKQKVVVEMLEGFLQKTTNSA